MRGIIDGNNFLHFDAALSKRMRESGISSAMKLLFDDLAKAVSQGHHFHLVFDSGSSSVGWSAAKPGLEILFAEPGKTADDLILWLIRKEESTDPIQIVTNDFKDIGKRTPGGRIQHCSCADFRQRVLSSRSSQKAARSKGKKSDKPAAPRSKKQIDFWLDQFSEGDDL